MVKKVSEVELQREEVGENLKEEISSLGIFDGYFTLSLGHGDEERSGRSV